MFYLTYHVSTQTCRLRDVPHNFLCFISTAMFPRSVLTTRQPTFVVETTYHHSNVTYEPFSVSNFWHMKQCLRTLVLLIRKTVFTVKRRACAPLFWLTCAWTRLVVDTLLGNMSVEPKHRTLWDTLYTDPSSHEKICMRTRPCKSKSCVEVRFSQWIHITCLRVGQTSDLWHDFVCEKFHTYTSSPMWKCAPGDVLVSQNSAEKRLLVKNYTLLRLTVDTTCRDMSH